MSAPAQRGRRPATVPTLRQLEALDRISFGKTDEAMGAELWITVHGSRHRVRRLCVRLDAANRAHAVRVGFERGLLTASPDRQPLAEELGVRETQVLHLISWGDTNAQIARRLGFTEGYVKQVVTSLYRKLDATSRAHAVRLGFELGVLAAHRRWG